MSVEQAEEDSNQADQQALDGDEDYIASLGNEDDEGSYVPYNGDTLPVPRRVPQDIKLGQEIAIWYTEPYNKWYAGPVARVFPRRAVRPNVVVLVDGEQCEVTLKARNYNTAWVLPNRQQQESIEVDN